LKIVVKGCSQELAIAHVFAIGYVANLLREDEESPTPIANCTTGSLRCRAGAQLSKPGRTRLPLYNVGVWQFAALAEINARLATIGKRDQPRV
jgi:hypothetical protein